MSTDQAQLAAMGGAVVERFLASLSPEAETDADATSVQIMAKILHATSVDDVLSEQEALHARDYLDTDFTLAGVRFNTSDLEGGVGAYGLLEGADANGEPLVITCGARNVMAQAWKLQDMDALPQVVRIVEVGRPTARGYKPMALRRGEAAF